MIQTYELDAEIQKDLSPTKDIVKETEKPGGIWNHVINNKAAEHKSPQANESSKR